MSVVIKCNDGMFEIESHQAMVFRSFWSKPGDEEEKKAETQEMPPPSAPPAEGDDQDDPDAESPKVKKSAPMADDVEEGPSGLEAIMAVPPSKEDEETFELDLSGEVIPSEITIPFSKQKVWNIYTTIFETSPEKSGDESYKKFYMVLRDWGVPLEHLPRYWHRWNYARVLEGHYKEQAGYDHYPSGKRWIPDDFVSAKPPNHGNMRKLVLVGKCTPTAQRHDEEKFLDEKHYTITPQKDGTQRVVIQVGSHQIETTIPGPEDEIIVDKITLSLPVYKALGWLRFAGPYAQPEMTRLIERMSQAHAIAPLGN